MKNHQNNQFQPEIGTDFNKGNTFSCRITQLVANELDHLIWEDWIGELKYHLSEASKRTQKDYKLNSTSLKEQHASNSLFNV